MRKVPQPRDNRVLRLYGQAPGGGCQDLAVVQFLPGVGLYYTAEIEEALVNERLQFIPYLLSVLEVLRK